MLRCCGDRCWMITKHRFDESGSAATSGLSASRPPAEAPIPTTRRSPRSGGVSLNGSS